MTPADIAATYCKMGWALVPIPAGSKAPTSLGWQTPERAILTEADARKYYDANPTHNMGLLHGPSGTAALDVDNVEHTRLIFEAMGINYDQLATSMGIRGRSDRAKMIFRVPAGIDLKTHKISWPLKDDPRKTAVVMEFRAGAVQDVLPPSIHPDTGRPYSWVNGHPFKTPLPEIPAQLLTIWKEWDRFRPQMMDACPWVKRPEFRPQAKPRNMSGNSVSVIDAFNKAYDMHDTLVSFGYKPTARNRYLSPNSTSGLAGVVLFEDGRAYSHHASDPFDSAHSFDVFDLWCQCEHGGDVTMAIREAARILNIDARIVTDDDLAERVAHGAQVAASIGMNGAKKKGKIKAPLDDIPDHLLNVPGVLADFVNYYNSTAQRAQPQFAVQAALAFGSVVLGRRFSTCQSNFSSVFFMCVAGTATGKEHVKRTIEVCLEKSGLSDLIGPNGYTSGAGVLSSLIRKPTHLCVQDEQGRALEAARNSGNSHKHDAMTVIMEVFGRVDGTLHSQGYSTMTLSKSEQTGYEDKFVHHPALTYVGMTTPETYYGNLGNSAIFDGYLNRFLIVDSVVGLTPRRKVKASSPSDRLLKWASEQRERHGSHGNLSAVDSAELAPDPVLVPFADGCWDILEKLDLDMIRRMKELDSNGVSPLLGRTQEVSMRIALIVAVSKGENEVSPESLQWAIDYVTFYAERTIRSVMSTISASDFETAVKQVFAFIQKRGAVGALEREIVNYCHHFRKVKSSARRDIIEALCSDHDVIAVVKTPLDGPGRKPTKPTFVLSEYYGDEE